MTMTVEALQLFLQSLPSGCMFEIISFGSDFRCSSKDKKGYVYSDKTLKQVKDEVSSFKADLGGTEIYEPLEHALKIKTDKAFAKKIFILTDGAISYTDKVIELAKKNAATTRVHTFGVGYGCSKYLVKQVAKAGRGSYSFVEEGMNLKTKVITALKKAIEPSLQDCSIQWSIPLNQVSTGLQLGEIFRNELVNHFAIVNKQDFDKAKVTFKCEKDPITQKHIQLNFEVPDFQKVADNNQSLFKVAAHKYIKELKESDDYD